jgi:beta-phosphoglucomutase-like phosphatase (HAD superfamily)
MPYVETSRRTDGDFVFTTIQYDFDGVIVETEIAHFQPQSEADITLGIENREVTERSKLTGGA